MKTMNTSISRFGKVIAFNKDNNTLQLNFEGNPLGQPIWGKIGRLFHLSDITMAINNQLVCRIEFMSNDLTLPILTDIYFSILDEKELRIKAKSIVLEGTETLTLKSGSASTCYQAKQNKIETSARDIISEAEAINKILGQKITLN